MNNFLTLVKKNEPFFFFVCLFSVFLLPSFFVVDIVGAHLFYFTIINTIFYIHLFFLKNPNENLLKNLYRNKIFVALFLFNILNYISIIWAENINEAFIKSIYWTTVVLTYFLISYYSKNISIFKIGYIVLAFLLIHLSLIFINYTQILEQSSYNFSFSILLKGLASNKNIASSVIFLSLPFVLIVFKRLNNVFLKALLFLVAVLSFYFIFALSSRSVFIAIFSSVLLFIFSLLALYFFKKTNYIKGLISSVSVSYLIPLFIAYALFNLSSVNQTDVQLSNRISTINVDDESTSNRIRFYKHALNQVSQDPFFGVGAGNWKFKSIYFDRLNIKGYTVPYHVHNDFLEIFTELGLLGLITYLALFIISFSYIFKSLVNANSQNEIYISFMLLISLSSFFVDSNLNFPHARLIQLAFFLLTLSFSSRTLRKQK